MSAPPLHRLGLAALLASALALVSCVGEAAPEGWAPALFLDNNTAFLSLEDGAISSVALPPDAPAQVRWTFPDERQPDQKELNTEGIYPAPVTSGTTVFIATFGEGLFALDAESGAVRWRRDDLRGDIIGGFAATPAGLLAVGTDAGYLYLLGTDGRAAPGWPDSGLVLDGEIWASIVATPGAIYVATMEGHVFAFDPSTTKQLWQAPFSADGAILELASLPNGQLFLAALDDKVYFIDSETGEERARTSTDEWVWMKPAVADGVAYFGDLGGTIYAVDITSGQLRWRSSPDRGDGLPAVERIKSQPALINGKLIVADRAPAAHFIDPADGRRLNRVPIPAKTVRAPVAEFAGTGLITSTDGHLFRANPNELSVVQIGLGANR